MTALDHSIQSQVHYDFIKMNQPEAAKNIHVYLNGDKYFPGRKVVVNRRYVPDFNGFLNQVTMGIKAPFGAVRNIYTPQGGHRVNDLNQLRSGMHVVAGGVERFRKLDYKEIGLRRRQKPKRNYLDIKIHNKMNVSARWRKYVKDPCQIYVYGNGDLNAPALRLLLIPRIMKTWDLVLEEITEKLSIRTGQAVRKLYDLDYRLLNDPSDLENGQYYVAVGTEKLKKYPYGEIPKQHAHRKGAHQPLPPIKRGVKSKTTQEIDEKSYTKLYAQKKQQQTEEETTVMGASAATGYRPLRAKLPAQKPSPKALNEAESVFHAKPVKVKRSSGKTVPPLNYEPHPPREDSDGVFRSKTKQFKAEEVDEDEDIKVDLPIDQVPADEVEEDVSSAPQTERRSEVLEAVEPTQASENVTPPPTEEEATLHQLQHGEGVPPEDRKEAGDDLTAEEIITNASSIDAVNEAERSAVDDDGSAIPAEPLSVASVRNGHSTGETPSSSIHEVMDEDDAQLTEDSRLPTSDLRSMEDQNKDKSEDEHEDVQSRNDQEDTPGSPGFEGDAASPAAQDDVTASLGAQQSGDDITHDSLTQDEAVASDAVVPAASEQAEDGKDLRVIKSGRTDATITPTALVSEEAAIQSNRSVEEGAEGKSSDADESEDTSSSKEENDSDREKEKKSHVERLELEEDKSAPVQPSELEEEKSADAKQVEEKEEAKKVEEETTHSDQTASISEDVQEASDSKSGVSAQLTVLNDHTETEIVSPAPQVVKDTKQENVDDSDEEDDDDEDESTSGDTDTRDVLSPAAPQAVVVVTTPSSAAVANDSAARAEPENNPQHGADEGDGSTSPANVKSPVSAVSEEASRNTEEPSTIKLGLAARPDSEALTTTDDETTTSITPADIPSLGNGGVHVS